MLNWNLEVLYYLLSATIMLISMMFLLSKYIKNRYLHLILIIISWTGIFLEYMARAMATLFVSKTWSQMYLICLILAAVSGLLMFDFMKSEHIDWIKMSLFTMISSIIIFQVLHPENIFPSLNLDGTLTINYTAEIKLWWSIFLVAIGSSLAYYMIVIHKNCPKSLKKYSYINIIGGIICGSAHFMLIFVEQGIIKPGYSGIVFSIGSCFTLYAFLKEPKLAYILPFKVSKLMIITKSGMPIYSYFWDKTHSSSDSLISGFLQGVRMFAKEGLSKGTLQEIHLDNTKLIIKESETYPIFFAIETNATSKTLRRSLEVFSVNFITKYDNELKTIEDGIEQTQFDKTEELVLESFPFIPDWE